jgi:hypothetical protein
MAGSKSSQRMKSMNTRETIKAYPIWTKKKKKRQEKEGKKKREII